jgi:hypothetical protein
MCPRFGHCASPLPGERRRHVRLVGGFGSAELAEPVQLAMPPGRRPSRRCRSAMVRCFRERLARQSAPRCQCGRISVVTRVVHVPYVVEQDEDGVWCALAQLRPGVGAVGDGPTAEAAVADLRDALEALLAEVGPPDELTLTLDVA